MADIAKPNFNNGLWASGGAIVAPSNTKIATGWTAEVPPFQWENYAQNRQDQGIAHILQHGISVWDSLTEYQAGKSYVQGSDGLIYLARTTHTNVNPVSDTSFVSWTKAASGGILAVKVFTATGTYTPTPGTKFARIILVGGGAAGAGSAATSSTQVSVGGGGGGGSFLDIIVNNPTTTTVTIGAGGVGISAASGGNGGSTTFGTIGTAPGGTTGGSVVVSSTGGNFNGGLPGESGSTPSSAAIIIAASRGQPGTLGIAQNAFVFSGSSGSGPFGGGVSGFIGGTPPAGGGPGAGGAGGASPVSSPATAGGNGASGIVYVVEYM